MSIGNCPTVPLTREWDSGTPEKLQKSGLFKLTRCPTLKTRCGRCRKHINDASGPYYAPAHFAEAGGKITAKALRAELPDDCPI